jgi:hypothetical protein
MYYDTVALLDAQMPEVRITCRHEQRSNEVDFVIEVGGGILAIEVASTS